VLLAAAAVHLRRAAGGRGMRLVARLGLEPRRTLCVVEVAGRVLLLSSSESGLALVMELERSALAALEPEPARPARLVDAWRALGGRS